MTTPPFDFRPESRSLVVEGETVPLTPREVEVIAYLVDRLDQVVTRSELEREVFGFAEGVQSETVPVTVRRLRAKLGRAAGHLETVWGTGWRLVGQSQAEASGVPRFATPYHPRPEDELQLRSLLAAGWRVVTIVGPGGSGKTRLASEIAGSLEQEVAWASVGGTTDKADVLRILMGALGLHRGGVASIEAALADRELLLVVDEAEVAYDAVVAVLRGLPRARMLITSRRSLGLEGEAEHEISRLMGADGRRFLRSRLAASRWGGDADEELVERAVLALDGLPLALELVAAHPDPLVVSVEELEAGVALAGPEGSRLEESLARSFSRLDRQQRGVLCVMSLCEGALSDEDLDDLLIDQGPEQARELASRSMVRRDGAGWVVLRTMRSFVRRQEADWVELGRSFDAWLVRTAESLLEQLRRDPRRARRRGVRLLGDLVQAIDRIDLAALPRFVFAIQRLLVSAGPISALGAVLRRAKDRAPSSLPIRVMALSLRPADLQGVLKAADAAEDPMCRFYGAVFRHWVGGGVGDWRRLEELIPQLTCPGDRLLGKLVVAIWMVNECPEQGLSRLRSLHEEASGYPTLDVVGRSTLAHSLMLHGEPGQALAEAAGALRAAEVTGLLPLAAFCAGTHASVLANVDPESGVAAHLEVAERWARLGAHTQARAFTGMAGLTLASMWRPEQARLHLHAAVEVRVEVGIHALIVGVCRAVLIWVEARGGDDLALGQLEATPVTRFDELYRTEGIGRRIIELFAGDVKISRALPELRAGLLRDLLGEQITEDGPALHPMLRTMVEGLRRRLESLEGASV